MIELDSRARDLLLALLQADAALPVDALSRGLNITPRQTRYALRKARPWLDSQGVHAGADPRGRWGLELKPEQRARLRKHLEQGIGYRQVLTGDERLQYELVRILTSEVPLEAKQLASELDVSHTTVRRDLDSVARWLEQRHLSFALSRSSGIRCPGPEVAYRDAVVELLATIGHTEELLALVCNDRPPVVLADGTLLKRAFWDYVRVLDWKLAARLVHALFHYLHLADSEIIDLFLHLAVAIKRATAGHCVELPGELCGRLLKHATATVVRGWAAETERAYRVALPADEVAALVMCLAGAAVADFSVGGERRPREEPGVGPVSLAVEAITQIAAQRLHPFLRVDPLLARGLTTHLALAVERLGLGLPASNPLADETRAMYPEVYGVAVECSASLERIIGSPLPPADVAFLAMHLAAAVERLQVRLGRRVLVVCDEDIAAAWLLVSRLHSVFPLLEVVDVISVYTLLHERGGKSLQADAIISTVPLSSSPLPTLIVSPLLHSEDIARVSKALAIQTDGNPMRVRDQQGEGPALADLLPADAIRLQATAADWQDATRQVGSLLVRQGVTEARYTEAMIALTLREGPYMVVAPGTALMHAEPQEGALRLGMALATLRKPVLFGHTDHDPVDLLFAFAGGGALNRSRVLTQLADVLGSPAILARLRQAIVPQQVQGLLRSSLPAR